MTERPGQEQRLVSGRYRLVEPLGSGGMGEVWRAHDERLHRTVAVKRMRVPAGPEAERVTRLAMREGRIAAKMQHACAITVYDVIDDDGNPCLVMEYLPSTSLSEVLASSGPLSPDEAARVGTAVAAGLAAAHSAGVVHRDVKPGNVLLGEDDRVKITDFGISRLAADSAVTATATVKGTPAYLAPEVARGDTATFASDVFSLGATLYAAVEGAPPFGRDDNPMALLYRVSLGEFEPPQRAGAMTPLLMRMLDVDPAARPTMAEVRDALGSVDEVHDAPTAVALDPIAFTPTQQLAPVEKPHRKKSALVVLVALALLAGGTVTALALLDDPGPSVAVAPPSTTPPAATQPTAGQPTAGQPTEEQPTTTEPPPVTTTNPPAVNPVVPPTPGDPAAALTDYYGLMPASLDKGWERLTEKFQRYPAGGYDGYQRFWGAVREVRVSGVSSVGENTLKATVDYRFADGRSVREVHRYVLVNAGGQWKIDQSTVLSSRPV
ncbi:serine/threonine-protein kinase [Actinokineospora globicatena]|uniref:non-specific serine/threonine protein kinase n=1 Tax=Actinokineospora globicatena TaxID=103729 RepID=A0A9W6QFV5_9PSEU|nr:serine/threonine-protein kinase [Actinokineospora globicatena]GLW89321.1 serine/threonine protein kinase [Actinokineospora globicatena]